MARRIIDLRSDTVTRPGPAMREAMATAEVGDDVYSEDPTVTQLEQQTAALLGKSHAVFVPSGTMANQLAIAAHTRPGDSVICEEGAHFWVFEAGAAAALSGVQADLIPLDRRLDDMSIRAAFRGEGLHNSTSRLLVVENTHNRGGGRVLRADEIRRIAACAAELGLAMHCDGARLWNAAVATGQSEAELVAPFATVSVCFSKGLGAPVGSVLAGSEPIIRVARKMRKRWGGGMRQSGILAAAALYALKHQRTDLAHDHRRARDLAALCQDAQTRPGGQHIAEIRPPETNMVYIRAASATVAAELSAQLKERSVLITPVGGGWLRAVTHRDLDDSSVAEAGATLGEVLAGL